MLTFYSSTNGQYALGSQPAARIEILDNDVAVLSMTRSRESAWENAGTTLLTATLDRPLLTGLTVPITFSSGLGAATAGSDYNLLSTNIFFPAGHVTAGVQLQIVDNNVNEPSESVRFSLAEPASGAAYRLGSVSSTDFTILDDDPLVSIAAVAANVSELGGLAQYRISLTAPTLRDVVVPISLSGSATRGSDYLFSATSVNIPAGYASALITIPMLNDSVPESTETLTMSLGVPTGAIRFELRKSASVNILDDDVNSPFFATPNLSISESRVRSGFFSYSNRIQSVSVQLPTIATRDVYVDLSFTGSAIRGSDYYTSPLTASRLRIPAGQNRVSFDLVILHDTRPEGNETIEVTITGVTAPGVKPKTTQKRIFTIIDDDAPAGSSGGFGLWDTQVPTTQPKPPITGAGTVLINTAPTIGAFPAPGSVNFGLPTIDINSNLSPGNVAIFTGNNGPIENATAFFDVNFNGVADYVDSNGNGQWDDGELAEPTTVTAADGSFSFQLDDFDLDGDGVEPSEGRLVLGGGIDTATGLAWQIPLTAPVGLFNLTPLSTLVESLTRTDNTYDVATAVTRVGDAFNLGGYPIGTGLSLYEVLQNDAAAARAYSAHVQLHAAALGVTQYLAGVSGRDVAPLGGRVYDAIAGLIASPDARLDFTQAGVIAAILAAAADAEAIDLPPGNVTVVSQTIADGIAAINSVTFTGDGEAFLNEINRSKVVTQGSLTFALAEFGRGERNATSLQEDYSLSAIDNKIDAAVAHVAAPPVIAIDTFGQAENDAGEALLILRITLLGDHDGAVSVRWATEDGTALAGSDYEAGHSVFNWAAGDQTERFVGIPVFGDNLFENDEFFRILLSQPVGAVIRQAEGRGYILNDDAIAIDNASSTIVSETIATVSDTTLAITQNQNIITDGEQRLPAVVNITGADDPIDSLTVDFSANTHRGDAWTFNGGSGDARDVFSAIAGEFAALEWTIEPTGSRLRLVPTDADQTSTFDLTGIEDASALVSSVGLAVLRVPVDSGPVVVAQSVDDPNILIITPYTGAEPIRITRPTGSLRILGLGGVPTVQTAIIDLTIETHAAGLILPTTSVNENAAGVDFGALTTFELGYEDATYFLPSNFYHEFNPTPFEIVDGHLRLATAVDYETTPEISVRITTVSGTGDAFLSTLTITVNDLVEAAPGVGGSFIQIAGGANQRSVIRDLSFALDTAIAFDPGAFRVVRKNLTSGELLIPVDVAATPDATGKIVTLRFSGSQTAGGGRLIDGEYLLLIDESKIRAAGSGAGVDIDGDGDTDGLYDFGDHEVDRFYALYGDANGDGKVDGSDYTLFNRTYRKNSTATGYDARFDATGDNKVDGADYTLFNRNYRTRRQYFDLPN